MFDFCKRHVCDCHTPPFEDDKEVLTFESAEQDGFLVKRSVFKPRVYPAKGIDSSLYEIGNLIAAGVNFDNAKPLLLSHSVMSVNENITKFKLIEQ